jgi:hypothetical protein
MRVNLIPAASMLAVIGLATVARADGLQGTPLSLMPPAAGDLQSQVQLAQNTAASPAVTTPAPVPDMSGFLANWLRTVEQAQASQPHWMTPLVTVTPRLEQEVRYDQYWETRGNGSSLDVFDGGKGLELIPTGTNEVLINPPAYQEKGNTPHPAQGWLDDQFLVVKQRLLSANEQEGNYIVTAFLGVTAASGNAAFTNAAWIITPTIAAGKGWGDFDVQATMGVALPTRNQSTLGTSVATNIAFQYHAYQYFWPELEINDTYWMSGNERGGKNQVLLTPGIIFGRFEIYNRIRAIVGFGYQTALSPKYTVTTEMTPTYDHAWILTTRLTF